MVKKKNRLMCLWIILVVLVIIAAGLFLLYRQTGQLIPDFMPYYDDFEAGLRYDLWELTEVEHYLKTSYLDKSRDCGIDQCSLIKVEDGRLKLLGIGSTSSDYSNIPTAKSTRVFSKEELKIRYIVDCSGDNFDSTCGEFRIGYGGLTFPITSDCTTPVGGHGVYTCYHEGILELKRYDDLDPYRFVIIHDGKEISTGRNKEEGEPLIISGKGIIDEVKYLPYYSCQIDRDTEVVVRKTFYSGSEVNIGKLRYYNPIDSKFCPKDLGILVYDEEGLRRQSGNILEKIAEGEKIIVPDNEYWELQYIAPYREDMKERDCGAGEFYSESQERCISTVSEKEKQEIPVPEIEIINTGQNQVTFTYAEYTKVAGTLFDLKSIEVLKNNPECQIARGEYLTPSEYEGCYIATIEWAKQEIKVKNGETAKLSDHILITYKMDGRGTYNGVKKDIDYNYEFIEQPNNIFTVTFNDIFDIKVEDYEQSTALNSDYDICFEVTNNIFDLKQSGYSIKTSKNIIDIFSTFEDIKQDIDSGKNTFCISPPTDTLGLIDNEVLLYFDMMENKRYVSEQKLSLPYVVGEIDMLPEIKGLNVLIWVAVVIISVAVIIIILFFAIKNEK